MKILVVEDDPTIAQVIETILENSHYAVDRAIDGQMGLDLSETYEYDAILLDVTLPKLDGISVCQKIRTKGSTIPILLLTALDNPTDRVRGLDAGADDYLSKPFDPQELVARIRALLRRSHGAAGSSLTWGKLQLDPVSATVTYADRPIALTPKEYALLELFLRNHQRVFSCNVILDHLWAYEDTPSEEAIRTHIKGLRHKLKQAGADADLIETVYGIGYRLKPINPPQTNLLVETWEKFKGQIDERVAELERLAVSFLSRDPQQDWQSIGRKLAHSLAGSVGTFGFSLSSELAHQIERLLSTDRDLTVTEGELLLSLVAALKQELDRPISVSDTWGSEPLAIADILLVSTDLDLNDEIRSMAQQRGWRVQIVPSIEIARSQLHHHPSRSILISPELAAQTETVAALPIEASKHVPAIPVILLANRTTLPPEIERLGTCIWVPPTSTAEIATTIERALATVASSQTHVLIVDDDLKVLAILQALLVPWGLRITTLADPQQFWDVLPAVDPDLLILDVEMPSIGGLELCAAVRQRAEWANLPIIFLTAHTEPSLIQQVFACGADEFVTKPVVGPEIVWRIVNLMERKQIQQFKTATCKGCITEHQVRSMLIEIEHSLQALQQDVQKTPESQQLLKFTSDRLERLQQILLANPRTVYPA